MADSTSAPSPTTRAGASGEPHGLPGPQPSAFGRLVPPRSPALLAYAQLEVLAALPSLQRVGGRG
jgi:hypothetical protein